MNNIIKKLDSTLAKNTLPNRFIASIIFSIIIWVAILCIQLVIYPLNYIAGLCGYHILGSWNPFDPTTLVFFLICSFLLTWYEMFIKKEW